MGWIKLDRKVTENPLWDDKPFARGQAWVDLLLLANHDEKEFLRDGKIFKGERGTVYRSIAWLAERWGWSRGKTRRFLADIQANKMCTINSTTHGTTITIEKYEFYQGKRPTNGKTDGQQTDSQWTTYKNIRTKKNNNINIIIPLVSEVERFVEENGYLVDAIDFYDYYSGQGWKKANGMPVKDWRACVRSWHRKAMKANETENASKDAREKRLAELAEQDRREIEEMNRKAAEFRKGMEK